MSMTYVYCENTLEEIKAAMPNDLAIITELVDNPSYATWTWGGEDDIVYGVEVRVYKRGGGEAIHIDKGVSPDCTKNGQLVVSDLLAKAGINYTYTE